MTYKMLKSGATKGAVSGKNRVWNPGQIIEAPAGEFKHMNKSHYVILAGGGPSVDPQDEDATAPEAPEKAVSRPKRKSKQSAK